MQRPTADGGSGHDSDMADFRKLQVWQKAHALALGTHELAGKIRGTSNPTS